jgi:hypothetical protein
MAAIMQAPAVATAAADGKTAAAAAGLVAVDGAVADGNGRY